MQIKKEPNILYIFQRNTPPHLFSEDANNLHSKPKALVSLEPRRQPDPIVFHGQVSFLIA